MKTFRYGALALGALMAGIACGPRPTPEEKPEVPPVEYSTAKLMSDAAANDLIQGDMKDFFQRLDPGFHTVVKDDLELAAHVKQMETAYGRLLEWRFKSSQKAVRKDGVWRRGARDFIYAARTTKYPLGKYFLQIEIVPDYEGKGAIYVSGFGYFTFSDGKVPENLR